MHDRTSPGDVLVEIAGVSKKYTRDLRRSIRYGCTDIVREFMGRGTPALLRDGEFWALQDISVNVRRGECLGIIGMNGAGKSSLLKVIGRVIEPDTGSARVAGRLVSLIEIGAGFHPLLTGRENIYLNGSIIGLTRRQIDARLDEIIAFSGIGQFIDAPVKTYSSGMYVRLGFAIAAHSEPDVLLLDEVLSVGDLEFTAKCLDFVSRCRKNAAVIFVSHDLRMISRICDRVLYLEKGQERFLGEPATAVRQLRADHGGRLPGTRVDGDSVQVTQLRLDRPGNIVDQHDDVVFCIDFECQAPLEQPVFNVAVHRDDGVHCFGLLSPPAARYEAGRHSVSLHVSGIALMPGNYTGSAYIWAADRTRLHAAWTRALSFKIAGEETTQGVYRPEAEWKLS